jgi:hypothetical protein
MMKKIIAVLVIFVCVGTALSAQINLSAGAGGLLGGQFNSYRLGKDSKDDSAAKEYIKYMNSRYINFGAFAFFDATYVEADLGLRFGTEKQSTYSSGTVDGQKKGTGLTYFTLGLFGKYPIDLGGFTIFPLAGIQYDFLLAAKNKNDSIEGFPNGKITVSDKLGKYTWRETYNRFWVKFGAGADINITRQIYVRPSFLYGFAFKNKAEKDDLDLANSGNKDNLKLLTHGFDIRVAAGYRF